MASSPIAHGLPTTTTALMSTTAVTTGSPTPQTPQPIEPPVSAESQPSEQDREAATILATLSGSRPATSHGEYEDYGSEDDDMDGGIALDVMDEDPSFTYNEPPPIPHNFPFAPFTMPLQVEAALHLPGTGDLALGQHAAALDSLSMTPSNTVPTLGLIAQQNEWNEHFLSMGLIPGDIDDGDPMHHTHTMYQFDPSNPTHEQYLNQLDKDQFKPVEWFYERFISKDGMSLSHLEGPEVTTREDLHGDRCDMQGINWETLRTTRASVRTKRYDYEASHLSPELKLIRRHCVPVPNTENYFSFRRMDTRHQAHVVHFQLRNLLAATSHNDIFYASRDVVLRTDSEGSKPDTVMDLTKEMTEAGKFSITTLAAAHDVLIAGGFEGEYALTGLSNTYLTPRTVGRIPKRFRDNKTHITNHIHLFPSRHTYFPQAVLSSNDNRLRILDCATNTFTHSFDLPTAVNCSATSPDGRLRVVVGDFKDTLITNAETGEVVETFKGHVADAFACDWADDGIHVATAAQDSTINIYDARWWKGPIKTLFSELAIPRSLKFSPVGSGPRVLVSAEADDYVSIYNAQTFDSKQVFDYFDCLGGMCLTPDGQSLFVSTLDPDIGGIMEFERCGWGDARTVDTWRDMVVEDEEGGGRTEHVAWRESFASDWRDEYDMNMDMDMDMHVNRRAVCGWRERERRGVDLASLVV